MTTCIKRDLYHSFIKECVDLPCGGHLLIPNIFLPTQNNDENHEWIEEFQMDIRSAPYMQRTYNLPENEALVIRWLGEHRGWIIVHAKLY